MGKRLVIIGNGGTTHWYAGQIKQICLLVGQSDPYQTFLDHFTRQYSIPGKRQTAALFQNCKADLGNTFFPKFLPITPIKLALEPGLDYSPIIGEPEPSIRQNHG
jgi:hypothetical protein